MTANEVIKKADELRQNTLTDEQKYEKLLVLEAQIAEMMYAKDKDDAFFEGKTRINKETGLPESDFPELNKGLLMPFPYDRIYVLYLVALIDYYNGEINLYQNDSVIFEDAKNEAFAWWRRNNSPKASGNWKVG